MNFTTLTLIAPGKDDEEGGFGTGGDDFMLED